MSTDQKTRCCPHGLNTEVSTDHRQQLGPICFEPTVDPAQHTICGFVRCGHTIDRKPFSSSDLKGLLCPELEYRGMPKSLSEQIAAFRQQSIGPCGQEIGYGLTINFNHDDLWLL